MTRANIALLLALAASAANATDTVARKVPKTATIKKLIEVSVAKGETWTLDDARTASLGYLKAPSTKEFIVGEPSKSTQLTTMVTFADDGKSMMDIILSSTTVTEITDGNPTAIDGYSFRADLKGKLISGIRAHGKVGDVLHEKFDATSAEAKRIFDALTKATLAQPTLTLRK